MLIIYKKIKKLYALFRQEGTFGRKVIRAIGSAIFLNLIFGSLFYVTEKSAQPDLTISDSIWWAMVTMTTVGYGDFSATTSFGRFVISYACMILGIGIIGYLIGLIAEYISQTISRMRRGLMRIFDEDHIIICNYPGENKLSEIIKEIRTIEEHQKTTIVLVSNKLEELPERFQKSKVLFLKGNPTDEDDLIKANILKSIGVIVLAEKSQPNTADERSFTIGTLIELLAKKHGIFIKTIVEVVNRKNFKLIDRANVEGMISDDGITSRLLVQEFLNPGIYAIIQQLLSNNLGSQFYIISTNLVGYKVVDLQSAVIKHPINVQIVGIFHQGEIFLNPPKTMEIAKNDRLILLAEKENDFEEIEKIMLDQNA